MPGHDIRYPVRERAETLKNIYERRGLRRRSRDTRVDRRVTYCNPVSVRTVRMRWHTELDDRPGRGTVSHTPRVDPSFAVRSEARSSVFAGFISRALILHPDGVVTFIFFDLDSLRI